MQRFGRSAQKMKDRWGGSFILATVLALVAAWYAGSLLDGRLGGNDVSTTGNQGGMHDTLDPKMTTMAVARDFTAYWVQAGAFKTEASATKEVDRLGAKGFHAAVIGPSTESTHHRVFVGPFTSEQARETAKAELKSAMKIDGFSRSWNISQGPTVPASTAGKNTNWEEGVALLNNYLQEASVWWENRAMGSPVPADALVARGQELKSLAQALQKQASDPAVAQLIGMANMAEMNANATATAAADGGMGLEEHKALQDYVVLLDSYRNWASFVPDAAGKQ